MNREWFFVVLGMAAVTYVPRLIPFLFPGMNRLPVRVRRFLRLVPPAALGALLIPDAFGALGEAIAPPAARIFVTLAAVGVSSVVAIRSRGIVVPVALSIVVAAGGILVFG